MLKPSKTFTIIARLTKPSQSVVVQAASVILLILEKRWTDLASVGNHCGHHDNRVVQAEATSQCLSYHGHSTAGSYRKTFSTASIYLVSHQHYPGGRSHRQYGFLGNCDDRVIFR